MYSLAETYGQTQVHRISLEISHTYPWSAELVIHRLYRKLNWLWRRTFDLAEFQESVRLQLEREREREATHEMETWNCQISLLTSTSSFGGCFGLWFWRLLGWIFSLSQAMMASVSLTHFASFTHSSARQLVMNMTRPSQSRLCN